MIPFSHFTSRARLQGLLCGSAALVLAGCGGGAGQDAVPDAGAKPAQLASMSYNEAAVPADLYVSTSGADTNAGTQAAPFRTIARAAAMATPGVTIRVQPGTYAGGFRTNVSGTAEAPIRYLSEVRRGAKIVPPASSVNTFAWDNRGSYVEIDGFEVNGSTIQAGTKWLVGIYTGGSYNTVKNNYVHHIAKTISCAGFGGGIGSDSYYKGSANNVVGNVVHDIGPAACASFHGLFIHSSNSRVANNLLYAVGGSGIFMAHDAANESVANNTVFNASIGIFVSGDGGYIAVAPNDHTRVSNNIVYDVSRYGIQESGSTGTGNVYANNLIYKTGSYATLLNNGLQASATVAAEPQFVNYLRAGGGDYHPAATSPAVKAGLATDAPATDLDGKVRDASTGIDVGAYQHLATGTEPPPPPPPPQPPPPQPNPLPNTTYHYYVAPNGSDNNSGTASAPFLTIGRASRAALPSTTVHVAPGTYAGGITTTANGSAGARIYYVSTVKWGAKIAGAGTARTGWDNRGNYVDIIGFQLDGSAAAWSYAIYNGGSYDSIRGNWVHHIAKNIGCTSSGGAAIGIDAYYHGVKSDVVDNLVHDIGPAGCRFIQGIYVSTSGSVKNNVVYRVAEAAIHLWHDATNVIITNNTVTTSHTGIIVGGGDFYYTSGPDNNTIVANNIVYDNASGISEQGQTGTGNRYTNNLVYQNSSSNISLRNGLVATGTVSAAPQFAAYTRTGTPDLHILAGSPAVGKGTATNAPAFDFDGMPRNSSTGYDIGAYQHR